MAIKKQTESVKSETEVLNPGIEAVSSETVPSQEENPVEENPNPEPETPDEVLGNELESAELVEFIFWVNFKHEETYYDKGNSVLMDKETAEMYQRNVLGEIRVSN